MAVVYTAATQSRAALEILVHAMTLSDDYIAIPIDIPDAIPRQRLVSAQLADWDLATTRRLGDSWLAANESAILEVPSKVICAESNFLLNPRHRDYARLAIHVPQPFQFDRRLLERFLGMR